jgi:hypothetical protein
VFEEIDETHLDECRERMHHESTNEILVGGFWSWWWRWWDRRIGSLIGNNWISYRSSGVRHIEEYLRFEIIIDESRQNTKDFCTQSIYFVMFGIFDY